MVELVLVKKDGVEVEVSRSKPHTSLRRVQKVLHEYYQFLMWILYIKSKLVHLVPIPM